MRQTFIILTFCMSSLFMQSQTNVDSLENVLETQELRASEKMEIFRQLCYSYMHSDLDKLRFYADLGLILANKEKDTPMQARFNEYIAFGYIINNSYDTAKTYLETALKYALDANHKQLEAEIYNNFAILYSTKGDIIKELEYYRKSLEIHESDPNKKVYVITLSNISNIHMTIHNYDQATTYLEMALEVSEEIDYNYGKIGALYGLGYCQFCQHNFNIAKDYILKALNFSEIDNNIEFIIYSTHILASIYLKENDYDNAEKYAEECLQLAKEFGNPMMYRAALYVLSDVYLGHSLYEKSLSTAMNAWSIDSIELVTAPDLAMIIGMANMHLGNKDKADIFFRKYADLKNKSTDKNLQETLLGLEVKYETEKKEMLIATLEKEKQFYIWLGTAGIVLLLLAFCVLFFRHRLNVQKRKNAEQQKELAEKQMILAEQQREISEQKNMLAEQQIKQLEKEKQLIATQAVLDGETAERSRLAKDLHNRLGGLLTVTKMNLKEIGNYSILEQQDVNRFDNALDLLDQSVVELRRIAHHLMPDSLIRHGLKTSIEDFCKAIPVAKFQYYGSDERMDNRLEIVLYQSAYELVNNAVKYAEATAINVQLMVDNGLVSLTVQDNGIGFDPDNNNNGTGIDNIRTHVLAYNGKMNIHSSPGNGTEICIEIENIKND